jgi:pyroglutamyl-peptidase
LKILITGFDPFGGEKINPSWEVVKSLPDRISSHQIVKLQIPTVFHESFGILKARWETEQPDCVLSVGQAGGRSGLSVERTAVNLDDARIPDNRGNSPVDNPVVPGGPDGYFSNLPVKAMVQASNRKGVPAELSYSAGTFVCNHIMYQILHRINSVCPGVKGGFVHVPFLPEQAAGKGAVPSMAFDTIHTGLLSMVEAIVSGLKEPGISMGRVC